MSEIVINFWNSAKDPLVIEAKSIKEAVKKAVKDGVNLSGVNLHKADLCYADLSGVNFSNADLSGANFYGANLSNADLFKADLFDANLSRTNLFKVDLSTNSLYAVNLLNANLRETGFSGYSLSNVDLRRLNLREVKINGKKVWAKRPVLQLGIAGRRNDITTVIFYADKSEPTIYCGCFTGTVAEFESKIHKTHAETFYEFEYMAMVQYIKTVQKYQLEEKG